MKDKRYLKKQVLYFLYRGAMWALWLLVFWNILMFFIEALSVIYFPVLPIWNLFVFLFMLAADFLITHYAFTRFENWIGKHRSFKNYFRDFLI
ncbi:hypothetical protein [Eubacterium sp. 1001713B170207_170306_E7]|uniref:hypothetical protein n=1 Tax=Eubacterium sp. 1001713B170207_170306_E7 TaxID=2787097 RepID=UPI00189A6C78|nr:hypothetical protein [Eubacterium sp. 1001713B170207_170306_E7]